MGLFDRIKRAFTGEDEIVDRASQAARPHPPAEYERPKDRPSQKKKLPQSGIVACRMDGRRELWPSPWSLCEKLFLSVSPPAISISELSMFPSTYILNVLNVKQYNRRDSLLLRKTHQKRPLATVSPKRPKEVHARCGCYFD